jgi:hypothetical protein
MKQTIKAGTRIEFYGTPAMGGFPAVAPERATIARWRKSNDDGTGINHVRGNPKWHVVQFDDGGRLMAHESRFRIVDNRAGAQS